MDLRALVALAGIVTPELLNRIESSAEVEEADGAGFDRATTRPEEEVMDDPMQSMGSDVDLSLRRYLKAKGDHVTVDETVYPDYTVEDVNEAYTSFKEAKDYGPGKIGAVQKMLDKEREAKKEKVDQPAEEGTYMKQWYNYSEDYAMLELYVDGKLVDEWDGYFGANETGNPLQVKFIEMAKENGVDPIGLKVVDGEDGDEGVFTSSGLKWNSNEATVNEEKRYQIRYLPYDSDKFKIVKGFTSKEEAEKYAKAENFDELADEWNIEAMNEADIDENAFNQAAAAAARAGKPEFEFNGKPYKTKMDKSTAHKLDDNLDMLRKLAGLAQ
jgi:hypothetical protein